MKQATRGWGDMRNTRNRNKSCQSHKKTIVGLRFEPNTRRVGIEWHGFTDEYNKILNSFKDG
ncbi:hypothetical protein SLEP1_g29980 [Rubroshorea leprosula]|uniref:Uncharacterized protein n=1 Tax=Rubroshorea leprosula TaxID=152421 RepID=A0AAV5K6P8_9ROSI|nr:hypothetical protein SLEP1_g29980 [Rubroshorea leprosula]